MTWLYLINSAAGEVQKLDLSNCMQSQELRRVGPKHEINR
jgi:hypothetical protein